MTHSTPSTSPSAGGVDRRSVLLGGAAVASLAAVSACGTSDPTSAPDGPPRRGGRLRAVFGGGGAQEILDPHRTNLYADLARSKALYDKLADFGDDLTPQPRLAESWTADPTGARWTVTLRSTTWHDGTPLRPADVLYSYRRILDKANGLRPRTSMTMIDIGRSRAIDDRRIEFVLTHPDAGFPDALAAFGAYVIKEGTTDFARPVGTGPFRFVSFSPGRSMVAARNDDYFDGAPHVDELEILTASEESARINALVGRQVEYVDDLTPTSARTYDRDPSVVIIRAPRSGMSGFAMKVDRPPFDKLELRQAMFHLVDREQMLSTVLNGFGEIGNDLFGKGYRYYPDDLPQREHSLETARSLVRKAGAQGLSVTIETTSAANGFLEAANLLREQAKAVDLDLRVVNGDSSSYWTRTVDSGVLSSFRSGSMPITSHLSQRFLSGATKNYTQWRRPDFDAQFHEAVSTRDESVRTRILAGLQRTLYDEGGLLVWGITDTLTGLSPKLKGMPTNAPANTLGYARFDKAWLV